MRVVNQITGSARLLFLLVLFGCGGQDIRAELRKLCSSFEGRAECNCYDALGDMYEKVEVKDLADASRRVLAVQMTYELSAECLDNLKGPKERALEAKQAYNNKLYLIVSARIQASCYSEGEESDECSGLRKEEKRLEKEKCLLDVEEAAL